MADKSVCKIEGCGKPGVKRGWCGMHYQRWLRHGDTSTVERVYSATGICSVEGCQKPHLAKGYCGQHYQLWKANGAPEYLPRVSYGSICSVEGCDRVPEKMGMCGAHYVRFWRHGDADTVLKLPNGETERWLLDHVGYDGDDCLIWPFGKGSNGYAGSATVAGVSDSAYRHMCTLAHGPQPSPLHEAAHSCGRGTEGCVHPKHVRWDTHQGNMDDQVVHGTRLFGEKVRTSKLTTDDVRAIRRQAKTMMQKDIAAIYSVKGSTISAILRGKSWAWLE
ncbi:MAG: hypothetical protein WA973_06510 [Mesorhizobium sp.]